MADAAKEGMQEILEGPRELEANSISWGADYTATQSTRVQHGRVPSNYNQQL